MTSTANSIANNIAALTASIRGFERRYGRAEGSVGLLAVSKRHGAESIRAAYAAGVRDFGESYLQEGEGKIGALGELDICWHFVGPLQSNKTRGVAEQFDWVHSVDREKTARRLSEQRPSRLAPLNVCVQVRMSDEAGKSGVAPDALPALCDTIAALPGLKLRGLMAIPAVSEQMAEQRSVFQTLAGHFTRLQARFPDMDTLSMGMSNDYEAAIAEGATLIRVGTAIFGPRLASSPADVGG
ncbi:MAG: YggS family pyridoxal phosphate-dependent enzyme [Pseudohongiellaceae bacterium]